MCLVSLRPASGLEMGDKKRSFSDHFWLDLLLRPSLSDESDISKVWSTTKSMED